MAATLDLPSLVRFLCNNDSETEWFEFKTNNEAPNTIGKNISALANSAALAEKPQGYVVWGVSDTDHEIVGATFRPEAKKVKKDTLTHWLSQRLKLDIGFEFLTTEIDSCTVVVLWISAAANSPVRFGGTAYVRVGPHTRKLRDFQEKERMLWRVRGAAKGGVASHGAARKS